MSAGNFALKAEAAATAGQLQAVTDAYNAGLAHGVSFTAGTDYTVSGANTTSVIITDKTRQGDVYNLAKALQAVSVGEGASDHNTFLRSTLKAKTGGINVINILIDYLLPLPSNNAYNSYTSSNKGSWSRQGIAYDEPGDDCGYNGRGGFSMTSKVVRSLSSAVLDTFPDSVYDVTGSVELSSSMTISTAVSHTTSVTATSYTPIQIPFPPYVMYKENNYRQCFYYNYNTGISCSTGDVTQVPDLSAVASYRTEVDSAEFRDGDGISEIAGFGYNAWKADYTSSYALSLAEAQNILNEYNNVYSSGFKAIAEVYRNYYCADNEQKNNGIDVIASYTSYVASVDGLISAFETKQYLEWLLRENEQDALYGLTSTSHDAVNPKNATAEQLEMLDNLTLVANSYRELLNNTTAETKTTLAEKFGYNFEAIVNGNTAPSYPVLLKEISDIKQQYNLYQIKYELFNRLGIESEDLNDIAYAGSENISLIEKLDMIQRSEHGDDAMSDEALGIVEWIRTKYTAILACSAENQTAVFSEENLTAILNIINEIDLEIKYRALEETYGHYYGSLANLALTDASSSFSALKTIITKAESDYEVLSQHYNLCVSEIGQAKTDYIYGDSLTESRANIDRLYSLVYNKTYIQHYNLLVAADDDDDAPAIVYADEVKMGNVVLVRNAINQINNEMYDWLLANNNAGLDLSAVTSVHNQISAYSNRVNYIYSNRWSSWSRIYLDSPAKSGKYTLRTVRDNDMARNADDTPNDWFDYDEEYEVTVAKVETVISKVDAFLVSSDFTKLLGVYRQKEEIDPLTGNVLPKISSLDEFIEKKLTDLIFNDSTATMIVSFIPMIAEMITTTLYTMLDGGLGIMSAEKSDGYADGAIWLPAAAPGTIYQGTLDLYLNGKYNSNTFVSILNDMGIKIYPSTFADALASSGNSKYNTLINDLRAAGNSWSNFDKNGDGTCNALDFASYKWGITDYNSFTAVLGDIFRAFDPLLRTLLAKANYSFTAVNAAVGMVYNVVGVYNGQYFHINYGAASASAAAIFTGVRLYDNVLIPIFEALGITASTDSYTVTEETPLSRTIGTSGNGASIQQLVNAICMPIRSLIKKLANAPLDTLLSILPNIAMFISNDGISPLFREINLDGLVYLYPNIIYMDEATVYTQVAGQTIPVVVSGISSTILGIINNYLNANPILSPMPLDIGSNINLSALLGVDASDINALLNKFFGAANDLQLPAINAGRLAGLGDRQVVYSLREKNFANGLGEHQRYNVVADKADVLYDVLMWVLEFISVDGNVAKLMTALGLGELDPTISAILSDINPSDGLAALIELFLPQIYKSEEYTWFTSNQDGSEFIFDNTDYSSFVYLEYANDWTQEKAEYVYENIDATAEALLEKTNPAILMFHESVDAYMNSLVNGLFTSGGIDNLVNILTGIGFSLINNAPLAGILSRDFNIDIMAWYNSFGYLNSSYVNIVADLDANGNYQFGEDGMPLYHLEYPPNPEDADYVNYFPHISCESVTPLDGNGDPYIVNGKEYKVTLWKYDGEPLYDTQNLHAREQFTDIFADLLAPFATVFNFLLTGESMSAFNNAIVINGYDCYSTAVIPLFEAFGIFDMLTPAEYKEFVANEGAHEGFKYIINKVFDKITWLLSETTETDADGNTYTYRPLQKIIDTVPNLLYFIQSGNLTVVLKNIIQPVWVLVDTIRPVLDIDIDGFIHKILCTAFGLCYDKEDPQYQTASVIDVLISSFGLNAEVEYDAEQAAKDKDIVDGIYSISIEKLTIGSINAALEKMFSFSLMPLTYALEGMCVSYEKNGVQYGVTEYQSQNGSTAKRLNYYGPDTITVLISAVLDVLRYKDNPAMIDRALALILGKTVEEMDLTATGIFEAITNLFEEKEDVPFQTPNWDYMLENKVVHGTDENGNVTSVNWVDGDYTSLTQFNDLSTYHSIKNLNYATDWTYNSASATVDVLGSIADAFAKLVDSNVTDFSELASNFVNNQLFCGQLLSQIVNLTTGLFNNIPPETVALLDTVLDTDMSSWLTSGMLQYFEAGVPVFEGVVYKYSCYKVNPDYLLWNEASPEYITTREGFMNALKALLQPVGKLIGIAFFDDEYRLLQTIGDGQLDLPENDTDTSDIIHYGDDALIIDGLNLYSTVVAPLFEALGVDTSECPADKYNTVVNGYSECNSELFINDFIDMLGNFLDKLVETDPIMWLLDAIPELIFFTNAGGFNSCLANSISAIEVLVKGLNFILPGNSQIDITEILSNFDIKNISISQFAGLLFEKTGVLISPELTCYLSNLYVGSIEYYQSANGQGAFRMKLNTEEDRADLITILLSVIVEILTDEGTIEAEDGSNFNYNNPDAIEKILYVSGTEFPISKIIDIIKHPYSVEYQDMEWNYFDGTTDSVGNITPPATPFLNYFTYVNDWTADKANVVYDNLGSILNVVLSAATGKPTSVANFLKGALNPYGAQNVNNTIEYIKKTLSEADASLVALTGIALNADIDAWLNMESVTSEQVYNRTTFIDAVYNLLEPVFPLLDWLLFGKSYEFFVAQSGDGERDVLITIPGSEGYEKGLVLLLEALGVELPEIPENADCEAALKTILNSVYARLDRILANPIDELLNMLPNVLYFINANGLSITVRNIFASVLTLLDKITELGIAGLDINTLLGINLDKLDLAGIFTMLEEKIAALNGFSFNEPFTGNCTFNEDGSITFVQSASGENYLEKFYIGNITKYISANGAVAYKMTPDEQNRGDLITFVFSFALELLLHGDNSKVIDRLASLPEGTIAAIAALLTSEADFNMQNIDWVYFLGLEGTEREAAVNAALSAEMNELPELPERTLHYLEYDNNWNEETAQYLVDNLPSIIDSVMALATDSDTLTEFINNQLNLYSDDTVNLIIKTVADKLRGMDKALLDTLGAVLDVDLDAFMSFKSAGVSNRLTFVITLSQAFGKLGRVLDWILFDREYTFFTELSDGTTSKIVVNGGEGYKYGLAPLLAALGVETDIGDITHVEEGYTITEQVLPMLIQNVCVRIDEILANPIPEALDLLLEAVYFVNANGLSVCASNLLAPVDVLLNTIEEKTGKDLSLAQFIGFEPSKLDLEGISSIVLNKTELDIYSAVGDYLSGFYFGELQYYKSYEDEGAFRMVYTETEQRHDFTTILLSVVLDVLTYSGNRNALVEMFGENGVDIYNVLMAFLTNCETEVPMHPYAWILMQYANTDTELSPITMGSIYDYLYGTYYTKDMGDYMTANLDDFLNVWITLLGLKASDGSVMNSLEDVVKSYLGGTIYRTEILETVLGIIQNIFGSIKSAVSDTLYGHISSVINSSMGVDLNYWNSYNINPVPEGNRSAFVGELTRMLRPAIPLLEWLLTNKDFSFFNKDDGVSGTVGSDENSYIILRGAEGYNYSIIPILEALGLHEQTLTPFQYKTAAKINSDSIIKNILNPVLDKVDAIFADPIDEILSTLPGVIYFINSNGLDTAFKNLLNAAFRILETIEPLTGEINLYEKLGFNFTVNFEGMLEQLLGKIDEQTGFRLSGTAMEAVKELTVGKVVSFQSKNGETAYTMVYNGDSDRVDTVTVVLRAVLTFISEEDNENKVKELIKPYVTEDGYKFICSLLDNISEMSTSREGMDKIMYTVYYLFYATYTAGSATLDWQNNFNGNYKFLFELLNNSDVSFLSKLGKGIGTALDLYFDDIIDSDGLAPKGAITFFEKIAEFFNKIIEFFRNLFK